MSAPISTSDPLAAAAAAEAGATPDQLAVPDTTGTQPQFVSYWGYAENFNVILPGQDKIPAEWKQYIVCQKMNEGLRQKYQHRTNSKVTILKESQNAEMGVDPARDRRELITASVVGWKIFRADPSGKPYEVPHTDRAFKEWFEQADPVAIEALERKIRDMNPWMQANMTPEAVQEEIDRLEEVRDELIRKQGEDEAFH